MAIHGGCDTGLYAGCPCCGASWQGGGCFGPTGYLCMCDCYQKCRSCGRCLPETKQSHPHVPEDLLYEGHCRCEAQREAAEEAKRLVNVRDGW